MQKYRCTYCGYIYYEEEGEFALGIPAGTLWDALPDDWVCPICGAGKNKFIQL